MHCKNKKPQNRPPPQILFILVLLILIETQRQCLKHWPNISWNTDGCLFLNYFEKWNNSAAQIFALGITNFKISVMEIGINNATKVAETFATDSQMYNFFQV